MCWTVCWASGSDDDFNNMVEDVLANMNFIVVAI